MEVADEDNPPESTSSLICGTQSRDMHFETKHENISKVIQRKWRGRPLKFCASSRPHWVTHCTEYWDELHWELLQSAWEEWDGTSVVITHRVSKGRVPKLGTYMLGVLGTIPLT